MSIVESSCVEEKKEELDISMSGHPPSMLSPSKQRAKSAGSAGLSELSRQLRILQAKNEAQAVEVNRLERQLRILAELQGVSVADLRKALADACANEAFGELQHCEAKLRAELEAANLAKHKQQAKSTTAPHIANLELRVGELEEVEDRHKHEIHHLYEELAHERSRATRLESEVEQHKADSQDYMQRLNKETSRANALELSFQDKLQHHQLEQARKMQDLAKVAKEAAIKKEQNTDSDVGDTCILKGENDSCAASNAESELMAMLLEQKTEEVKAAEKRLQIEKDRFLAQIRLKEEETRNLKTKYQIEQGKMNLTINELKDADSQSDLRLAQFKARFTAQDERIDDMEQQLKSLYTAFGLIKEERDTDEQKRATLETNLTKADQEIARQVEDEENQQHSQTNTPSTPNRRSDTARNDPWSTFASPVSQVEQEVPQSIHTPGMRSSSSGLASPIFSNDSPTSTHTSRIYSPARSYNQSGVSSHQAIPLQYGTPNSRAYTGNRELIIQGVLLVKSKSIMRNWKSKFSSIHIRQNHYHWEMEGKSYSLGYGISKVEYNPNHPLSFIVYCNPFDNMAPVVHAAVTSEADYHRWIKALHKITTGKDYNPEMIVDAQPVHRPSSMTATARQYSGEASVVSGLSVEEREAADLEHALRMSRELQ